MNLNSLFIDMLPFIDLHGFDRDSARVAINDFVRDSHKMGDTYIVIIHGIGSGILKDAVRETLRQNHLVQNFVLSFENPGCTIVEIKEK